MNRNRFPIEVKLIAPATAKAPSDVTTIMPCGRLPHTSCSATAAEAPHALRAAHDTAAASEGPSKRFEKGMSSSSLARIMSYITAVFEIER